MEDPAFLQQLRAIGPRVAIVVAFGQIFRTDLLELPTEGCINLHASLLPRFRGAAPIQAAILAGETRTGVTTMQMSEGLDSGDILLQEEVRIGDCETTPDLSRRLSEVGAELVVETIRRLDGGELTRRPQDEGEASLAPRLRKSDGCLDWRLQASEIFNRVRALKPWPGTSSRLRGETIKIDWGLELETASVEECEPGTVVDLTSRAVVVACGGGTRFGIERLQRPGRSAVDAAAFVNGERLEVGERFE